VSVEPVIEGTDPQSGLAMAVRVAVDGTVAAVEFGAEPGAPDALLSPGLVDLQVNGWAGHDVNAPDVDATTIGRLARALLELGVTRFLPTIVTAAPDAMLRAVATVAEACAADPLVARTVAGLHVEGPFIDPADGARGAHPAAHVRRPDLTEVAAWQAASGGRVRVVTLSPHWPDAAAFVAALAAQGIAVAIGHTGAAPEAIAAAASAGAVLSTHLGNGAAAMLPRHPNLIWTQLADDRLTATLIADGHHLPADTLRVFLRAKGLSRCVLVSDSVALGGCAPGRYETPVGGAVELSADGRLSLAGTPYLAGAARSLLADLGIAQGMTGLPLADLLPLATANPARFAGGGARLVPGERADVIRLAPAPGGLALRGVWLAGERVV
jgi:N-acetylglucosamine-6-phosphate deacetylase